MHMHQSKTSLNHVCAGKAVPTCKCCDGFCLPVSRVPRPQATPGGRSSSSSKTLRASTVYSVLLFRQPSCSAYRAQQRQPYFALVRPSCQLLRVTLFPARSQALSCQASRSWGRLWRQSPTTYVRSGR